MADGNVSIMSGVNTLRGLSPLNDVLITVTVVAGVVRRQTLGALQTIELVVYVVWLTLPHKAATEPQET